MSYDPTRPHGHGIPPEVEELTRHAFAEGARTALDVVKKAILAKADAYQERADKGSDTSSLVAVVYRDAAAACDRVMPSVERLDRRRP